MREAASDVCSIAHERAATKQLARTAAAHPGFDEMAPAAALLALRICTSYSTRLAPCIPGHLVRNAAHEGFCISLLGNLIASALRQGVGDDADPAREQNAQQRAAGGQPAHGAEVEQRAVRTAADDQPGAKRSQR